MRLLNFTIIKLTFFLIIGIIVGYFYPIDYKMITLITSSLIAVLLVILLISRKQLKKTIWFGVICYSTLIFIGILTVLSHNQKHFPNHYSHLIKNDKDALTAISFRVHEVLKPNPYYHKYIVHIFTVKSETVKGKLLLNVKKSTPGSSLKVDDIYNGLVEFKEINPPLNPNQFNYKAYLEKQYIYHQIFTNRKNLFKTNSKQHTIFGFTNAIRNHINSKLKHYNFNPDELAIINALLLGQRQNISEEIYSHYAQAGAIHILAVSGLHVGIMLLIFSYILKPLEQFKYGKLTKMILLIGLLWGFALIAGLSASVTRAVTMFSVIAIATNLKRPTNIYNTLAISMFIILLFKPLFLFDVGFQLSYLAVFSIITIDPLLYKRYQSKYWITDKLWHTFTVTIAAQLGIVPVSLYYFHQFPGLFFISNLVIIPVLGLILGIGILIMGLAILNTLPAGLADFYGYIISSMNNFVNWISKQDQFLFTDIPFNFLYLVTSYIFILALISLLMKRTYNTLKSVLIALLFVQLAVIITDYNTPNNKFIIFHRSKHTLIGQIANNKIKVAHNLGATQPRHIKTINNYIIGNHIKTVEKDTLQSVYILHKKTLLVVDSLGVYNVKSFKADYVLLRGSPKLNLNRLIDSVAPKQLIADGSNYKSYVSHWKAICKKRKLPFHNTNEMGAYILDY